MKNHLVLLLLILIRCLMKPNSKECEKEMQIRNILCSSYLLDSSANKKYSNEELLMVCRTIPCR